MIRTFDYVQTTDNLDAKSQIIGSPDSYLEIEYTKNQEGIRTDTVSIKTPGLLQKLYNWIFQPELESDLVVYSSIEDHDDDYQQYVPGHAEHANHVEQLTVRRPAFETATSYEAELAAKTKQIHQALRDWQNAVAYFESVDDPSLIDYAVFDMEAAKRKYIYLLNSAKEIRHVE